MRSSLILLIRSIIRIVWFWRSLLVVNRVICIVGNLNVKFISTV